MKLDRPVFSSPLSLLTSGDNWLSILFLIIAVVSGVTIAVAIWQLGWIGLLAAPFLFFLLAVLIRPELGLGAFIFIIVIQLTPVINQYYPEIPSPGYPLLGVLGFLIIWRIVIYGDRADGWKTRQRDFGSYGFLASLPFLLQMIQGSPLPSFKSLPKMPFLRLSLYSLFKGQFLCAA